MPRLVGRSAALLFTAALAAGCGSTASPSAPSNGGGQLLAPTVFRETAHKIAEKNNEVQLSWTSSEASFQLVIGTTPGSSNVLTTTVTSTAYTWVSPREAGSYYARVFARRGESVSPSSDELAISVVDMRNVIDAMYFHAGPMSDAPANANTNPAAAVFADGTRLRVLVSNDATETARANAQIFADQYAALVGGAVTAAIETTSEKMLDAGSVRYPVPLPEFTIGIRVQSGICSEGALACANYGPSPIGPNKSIITLAQTGGLNISAVAHEMGHAYGMGHIITPATGRAEFRFMMHTSASSEQMTDAEKLAVTVARQGGIRPGMLRSEAQARDLVNPFAGTSTLSGVRGASPERRDAHGWIWVDAIR